jgi:nucleoside-diphosphate-sugar epimerase
MASAIHSAAAKRYTNRASHLPLRVAVTGASGFVGRSLCTALSAAGHELAVPDLRTRGEYLDLAGAGAVVHLAAVAHRRADTPSNLRLVNVRLTQLVGRAAAAGGARMIFASTVKVHGEESDHALKESSPLAPADPYARSKAEAEDVLQAIPGLQLVVLRPPLVYGPAVKANFLTLMRAISWGFPLPLALVANRRSLVYVGNLADAILRCLVSPRAVGRTYLISDGVALSTPALCRAIGAALGRPARLFRFPPKLLELLPAMRKLSRSLELDDSAIRSELGWRPPFTLEEGLRATADWYRTR